jgi:hypothetical protein
MGKLKASLFFWIQKYSVASDPSKKLPQGGISNGVHGFGVDGTTKVKAKQIEA